MDTRRMDTASLMRAGIMDRPVPQTDVPKDRERQTATDLDGEYAGHETVVRLLDEGKVVEASNYYGIPVAWKRDDGTYRGILLQYRVVTEEHEWDNVGDAAGWFGEMFHATDG